MKQSIHRLVAVTVVAAASLCAQTSSASSGSTAPTPPTTAQIVANLVSRLTAILTLTSTEQTEAATIFTTMETSLATIATSMQTERTALQTAIIGSDSAGIATAATSIGPLTTELVQAQATAERRSTWF